MYERNRAGSSRSGPGEVIAGRTAYCTGTEVSTRVPDHPNLDRKRSNGERITHTTTAVTNRTFEPCDQIGIRCQGPSTISRCTDPWNPNPDGRSGQSPYA